MYNFEVTSWHCWWGSLDKWKQGPISSYCRGPRGPERWKKRKSRESVDGLDYNTFFAYTRDNYMVTNNTAPNIRFFWTLCGFAPSSIDLCQTKVPAVVSVHMTI